MSRRSSERRARCPWLGLLLLVAGCSQAEAPAPTTQVGPGDAALTCAQIGGEIKRQNSLITQASAAAQQGGQTKLLAAVGNSQVPDLGQSSVASGALVPGAQGETASQIEADRVGSDAVARANALVALGRQKKCFQ